MQRKRNRNATHAQRRRRDDWIPLSELTWRDILTQENIRIIVMMALFAVVMMLAYNIGHYDSLQYQKWHDECVAIRSPVNMSELFGGPTINLNISGR